MHGLRAAEAMKILPIVSNTKLAVNILNKKNAFSVITLLNASYSFFVRNGLFRFM